MARIQALPGGRSSRITYGTNARFTFSIRFPTDIMKASGAGSSSEPTAGTITVAGVTVTLGSGDIINPAAVAAKIKATAIAGYKVEYAPVTAPFDITLVNNTVGATAVPSVALGTATNILFYDQTFQQGVPITIGAQDDIEINGNVPLTFVVGFTGGTIPDLQFSNGPDFEQEQGALTYGAAVTLGTVNGLTNAFTLTSPARFARITTKASNTQASLYITR